MKNLLSLCALSAALAAGAQTNAVPEMTTAESSGLEADASLFAFFGLNTG